MKLSNTRAIVAMLALPFYALIKAFAHHRLHYDFMVETDMFVSAVMSAFGLMPKKDTSA